MTDEEKKELQKVAQTLEKWLTLEEEKAKAERDGDKAKAAQIQNEIDFLTQNQD